MQPSTAFVGSTVGHRQGVSAAVAFRVREDFIFLMIILLELSIKVDENSKLPYEQMIKKAFAIHITKMSLPR